VTSQFKAGIVEEIKAVIARQHCSKHISMAINKHTTVEDVVFAMWPLLGNGSCSNKYSCNNRRTVGSNVFYAMYVEAA
jgi:hypothetical protein